MKERKNITKNSSKIEKERFEFKQKIECLKKAVNYIYLLQSLGFEIERDSHREIRSTCLIHGGDNKTAFRFNKDLGTWVCFTNKCHETFGNDILGLIMAVKKISFIDAVSYLEEMVGDIGDVSGQWAKFKRDQETDRLLNMVRRKDSVPYIVNEKSLRQFTPFRSKMFLKEGFSTQTLDFFEIAGGYTDDRGVVRDIIPIRNDYGKLMAYSLRDIREDVKDDSFKYLLTTGFDKDKVLYNLNNAKEYCQDKPLIIVEGFKGVWRLYDYGIKNAVAVMGSSLTEGQRNLLCTLPLSEGVVLFLDGDKAGVEGTLRSMEALKGNIKPIIPVFITETGKDPSDLSKEQVHEYLKGCF